MKLTKKLFTAAVISLSLFSSAVLARDYKENTDYIVISMNKTSHNEIREFFSFFCSHCFALKPSFDHIKKAFEGKAIFEDNPIGMLGGDSGLESQRAYAVARNMEIADEFKTELFDRIHVQDKIPQSHEDYVELFASLGVPAEKYEQDFNSFVTVAKVAEFDRYVKDYNIDAVPELVVNGKYLAKTDNVDTEEDYVKLIDFLLTLP